MQRELHAGFSDPAFQRRPVVKMLNNGLFLHLIAVSVQA